MEADTASNGVVVNHSCLPLLRFSHPPPEQFRENDRQQVAAII